MASPREITVTYLFILRGLAIFAFLMGSTWLANWHHHDASLLNSSAVLVPFALLAAVNVIIARAR
jgi:hypothetical protein